MDSILDIPKEVSTNNPKITILGFEQVYIDYFIRLNTYTGIININGFNLKLIDMTSDDIMVTGKIDSIDFESMEDTNEVEEV